MGGKRLKFPKRGKYVPPENKVELNQKEETPEEKEAKLKVLRDLGLIK